MNDRCENTYVFDPKAFADGKDFRTMVRRHRQCRRKATEGRHSFRFGNAEAGEPALIEFQTPLCRWCADSWDEARAEAEVEARLS